MSICEVQGGWVLVSFAPVPVFDNTSVGLSLPICKLGLKSAGAGQWWWWEAGVECGPLSLGLAQCQNI